jgi:hypothetical protein
VIVCLKLVAYIDRYCSIPLDTQVIISLSIKIGQKIARSKFKTSKPQSIDFYETINSIEILNLSKIRKSK